MLVTNHHQVKTLHIPWLSKSPLVLVKHLPRLFFLTEVCALQAPALSTDCKQERDIIRRGIKQIVINIGAYHFCPPLTKFYPTLCSQG